MSARTQAGRQTGKQQQRRPAPPTPAKLFKGAPLNIEQRAESSSGIRAGAGQVGGGKGGEFKSCHE